MSPELMQNLFANGPLQAKQDPAGVWGYDRMNNCIVRTRTPGKSTIGDIRIKYYVASNALESGKQIHMAAFNKANVRDLPLTRVIHPDDRIDFKSFVAKYFKAL